MQHKFKNDQTWRKKDLGHNQENRSQREEFSVTQPFKLAFKVVFEHLGRGHQTTVTVTYIVEGEKRRAKLLPS